MLYPKSIQNLINEFNKLPGIGSKTSQRFVFYLLKQPKSEISKLIYALEHLREKILFCSVCHSLSETDPCSICSSNMRDKSLLCVVASTEDLLAIEFIGEYKGVYHILSGTLNTLEGITPEMLNIKSLVERIKSGQFKEVILAFNPDIEGETTVMYLKKVLESFPIKITKLARGLPMGSDIEYADEVTLSNALKNRNIA